MALPQLIQKRGAVHLTTEEPAGSIRLLGINVPQAIVELVPQSVARENGIFPLKLNGDILYCAAADASKIDVADKLTFILNKRIKLVPAAPADIRAAIERAYPAPVLEDLSIDVMRFGLTDTDNDYLLQGAGATAAYAGKAKRPGPRPSLARTVVEFKKGFNGLEDEVAGQAWQAPSRSVASALMMNLPKRIKNEHGKDFTGPRGETGVFYATIPEGQRALMTRRDGSSKIVVGPARVWRLGRRFDWLDHYVAHPGEFLVVQFRDGRQDHVPGPAEVWFDPRVHQQITRQEALQLAAKEAVIVYSRPTDSQAVSRRIVYGPTLFVPAPGEWLHTFTWHGSDGGSQGVKKVAKGLVFQKLWLMPDQMYHDVPDVRTADDAVLTIRLMMFFELTDIERMLDATHDPVGDFVNAATSDVVDFTSRRTFDRFKQETSLLNELDTYRQLTARAAQTGYRINKVVYRGYGAPDRLQSMHDQAIEARTKLQLERATEQQAQDLEDFKLTAQMARATKRRTEQAAEVESEIELARKRQEAELRQKEAERSATREQRRRDAESGLEVRRQADDRERQHLGALKDMGVDLTAYLTQGRADRVIELRGGNGKTHVHLDRDGTA